MLYSIPKPDNLELHKAVTKFENVTSLQIDPDSIILWYEYINHLLTATKCAHITYTKKLKPLFCKFKIKDVILETIHEIRDFGVI